MSRDQAEVIAGAIGHAVEQGDHVTSDQFKTGLAELRTETANLETRLIRWLVGTVVATATWTVGILRLPDRCHSQGRAQRSSRIESRKYFFRRATTRSA